MSSQASLSWPSTLCPSTATLANTASTASTTRARRSWRVTGFLSTTVRRLGSLRVWVPKPRWPELWPLTTTTTTTTTTTAPCRGPTRRASPTLALLSRARLRDTPTTEPGYRARYCRLRLHHHHLPLARSLPAGAWTRRRTGQGSPVSISR